MFKVKNIPEYKLYNKTVCSAISLFSQTEEWQALLQWFVISDDRSLSTKADKVHAEFDLHILHVNYFWYVYNVF